MIRVHRAEWRTGFVVGIVFGRDDRGREVFAVEPSYLVRQWADRLAESEDPTILVSLPASHVRPLAEYAARGGGVPLGAARPGHLTERREP